MAFIRNIFMCLQLWCITGIRCQTEICKSREPVLKFCTDDFLSSVSSVTLATADAPEYRENSCVCSLSPPDSDVDFNFRYIHSSKITDKESGHFNINNISLNSELTVERTTITENTDIVFSTTADFRKDNSCLLVTAVKPCTRLSVNFNITCRKPETWRAVSSVDRTVVVAVTVAGSLGVLVFAGSITILLLIVIRRRVARKINTSRSKELSLSAVQEDLASECQGQRLCVSEADHYMPMSHKSSDVPRDVQPYAMTQFQGHKKKSTNDASRIYESMHLQLNSVRQSEQETESERDKYAAFKKGSNVNRAGVGNVNSAHYYNLT